MTVLQYHETRRVCRIRVNCASDKPCLDSQSQLYKRQALSGESVSNALQYQAPSLVCGVSGVCAAVPERQALSVESVTTELQYPSDKPCLWRQ